MHFTSLHKELDFPALSVSFTETPLKKLHAKIKNASQQFYFLHQTLDDKRKNSPCSKPFSLCHLLYCISVHRGWCRDSVGHLSSIVTICTWSHSNPNTPFLPYNQLLLTRAGNKGSLWPTFFWVTLTFSTVAERLRASILRRKSWIPHPAPMSSLVLACLQFYSHYVQSEASTRTPARPEPTYRMLGVSQPT